MEHISTFLTNSVSFGFSITLISSLVKVVWLAMNSSSDAAGLTSPAKWKIKFTSLIIFSIEPLADYQKQPTI